ncbi:zinc finger protein 83-like isoform X2 [Palaemon carinicauda]|uniref:zinc finger protein 83-like isoform X2 n=1 Tax=Palaemon carinicauda TaxID=392227 RepID=UPI0035B676F6
MECLTAVFGTACDGDIIHSESGQHHIALTMEAENSVSYALERENNSTVDGDVSLMAESENALVPLEKESATCDHVIPNSGSNGNATLVSELDTYALREENNVMIPIGSTLEEDAEEETILEEYEIKVEISDEEIENISLEEIASETSMVIQKDDSCSKFVKGKAKTGNKGYKCSLCRMRYTGRLSTHLRECHSELLLFHCNVCGMGFMVKSTYEKHIKKPHPKKLYKCGKCEAVFKKQICLMEHMTSGHSGKVPATRQSTLKIFRCEICEKSYSRRGTLFRHLGDVHKNIFLEYTSLKKTCICKYCGKSFENVFDHEMHKKEHNKPPFICSICNSEFKGRGYAKNHVKIHLSGKPTCHICGISVLELKTLKRHMLTHTGEIKYLCEFCGEGFPVWAKFKTHTRKHTNEPIKKPFNCQICDKPFRDRGNLAGHMQKHRKSKDFICNICGKALGDKRTLKYHINRHMGETQYKCLICEKSFAYASYRTAHMRSHTKEKPFKCEQCGKYFSQRSSLNTHKKIHTGKKQHVCSVCNKAFLFAHYLKVHMRSHTGEKPFKCANCSKAFAQKCTLNVHLQNCLLR